LGELATRWATAPNRTKTNCKYEIQLRVAAMIHTILFVLFF